MEMKEQTIIFIADTSGSMLSRMIDYPTEAAAMLYERSPRARVGLIGFNHQSRVLFHPREIYQALSGLSQALEQMRADGGTTFAPPLQHASGLMQLPPINPPPNANSWNALRPLIERLSGALGSRRSSDSVHTSGKTIIVFLSDGHNSDPEESVRWAAHIKNHGVELHTVGAADNRNNVNERILQSMASWDYENNRPHYRFIREGRVLVQAFKEITGRLVVDM